jgi:tetratricopeptide (TPR) repeat protein
VDLHFEENENLSLKRFEKMLKTDNIYFFDSADFERIIHYYIDNGKINLAKKAINLSLEQHPDIVGLRLLKAELYILEENFQEAIQLLEEIEALEPTNEEVYIQKAMLLSKQEHHQDSIDLLEKAIEYSEDSNLDVLSLIAMEYLFLEDFDRALLYFRNCLEIDSDDFTTLFNVVYCYDMLEQHEEAIQFLRQYIDENPFSETAWHQLGRQYALVKNDIEALKAYDYAILIDDKFIGAYLEKAKTLESLQRYNEAIANYLITTELDDPTAFAFLQIGGCYESLNNYEKAVEFYLKSSEQDPYLDKPLIALSELFFSQENYQKALFYVNMLINIDDENPYYWKLYAQLNLKIAFFAEAAKAFQKCLDLNKNSLDIHLALADSHYFIGDYKEAIKVLIKAEIYYHNHAEIEYRLSGLHFLIKANDLGIKHLQKALHINAKKYRDFQKLFPTIHNSLAVKIVLQNFRSSINF